MVRRLLTENDYKSALRIASCFRLGISREDQIVMKRGYECLVYPQFYQSIHVDVQRSIESAKETIDRLYRM